LGYFLSSESVSASTIMVSLLKVAFVGFSLFAIATAPPTYKLAMYRGVVAYAQAMKDACVRPDGVCAFAGALENLEFIPRCVSAASIFRPFVNGICWFKRRRRTV